MGRDKALLPVAGVPMLQRIARAAREACDQLFIVGRNMPPDWPVTIPATFLPDAPFGASARAPTTTHSGGPLVGLITALKRLGSPLLLLPCDMPLITTDLLKALLEAHRPEAQATVAMLGEQAEPTLAVYTPRLLPALRAMLAENRRALYPLAALEGVTRWPVPAMHARKLFNVNDPASLAQAEATAIALGEMGLF
jgi:molybdopterin-guanine dinucleotide biosynthesis protein A